MQSIIWAYRQVFACRRWTMDFLFAPEKPEHPEPAVPVSSLPWLWVGAVHPNGTIVDHTTCVNNLVEMDSVITPEWLDAATLSVDDDLCWKYLDAKTLEEKIFPSGGIVIANDTEPQSNNTTHDD